MKPNDTSPSSPLPRIKEEQPDCDLVLFDEGEAIRIGTYWSREGTGKKPTIEIDISKIPPATTAKVRAFLLPKRTRKAPSTIKASDQTKRGDGIDHASPGTISRGSL